MKVHLDSLRKIFVATPNVPFFFKVLDIIRTVAARNPSYTIKMQMGALNVQLEVQEFIRIVIARSVCLEKLIELALNVPSIPQVCLFSIRKLNKHKL